MKYLRSKNCLGNPSKARNHIYSAAAFADKPLAATHTSNMLMLATLSN